MPLSFLYQRDILSGSFTLAFSTQWKGHSLAHIADFNLLLKVIKWAQIEAQISPQSTTMTISDHDKWSNNMINPLLHIYQRHPNNHHAVTHHSIHPSVIPSFINTLPNALTPLCPTYPPPSNYNQHTTHQNSQSMAPNQPTTK